MALSRDIVLRLLGDSTSAQKALKDAANAAEVSVSAYRSAEREQARQTAAMQKAAAAQSRSHQQMGLAALAMGAAVGLGLGLAVKAAVDWESAFAGVAKTVEGTPEQIAALEQSLRGLALILPVTHAELAAVAEAAGQLGIAREDIAAFTATAIALGETTNLAAVDAATGLAQLSNVMGTSADDTDRLGSALVELGNNGASTEADILQMAQRIAGAGAVIGLSEGDVLGLASALSSLGIEAEAGGSAISRVLIDMATAVDEGGEKLEQLAAVAGVSGAEFARMFRDDAAGALAVFTEGLGNVEAQGGSTFAVLEQLGYSEIRTRDALLRLAAGSDVLAESLQIGNAAWEENSALLEEAGKRYATTGAQLELARNALVDAGIDIGNTLIPVLLSLGNVLQGLIGFWQELPGPIQAVVVAMAALTSAGLLLGGGLTAAKAAMSNFAIQAEVAGGSVSRFGKAASGALAFVGGPWGVALGAAALVIGKLAGESGEATSRIQALTAAIEADNGALGENTRLTTVAQLAQRGLLEDARALGIDVAVLTEAMLGNAEAQAIVNAAVGAAAPLFGETSLSYTAAEVAALNLSEALALADGEITAAEQAFIDQQEALAGSTAATEENTAATDASSAALTDMAAAADALKTALDELTGTYISAAEAESGYQAATDSLAATIAELGGAGLTTSGQIDLTTEAGRTLQTEFFGLRDAGNEVIESLVRQGDVSGALAADTRLRENFLAAAAAAGIEAGEANRLADEILGVPTERHTQITTTANQAAAEVRSFGAELAALRDTYSVRITTTYVTQYATDYLSQGVSGGYAYGGQIGGYSPHSRADNIPILATAGEFMQPLDAVNYYGTDFMEAVRTKSLPRFASGGQIGAGGAGVIGLALPVVNVDVRVLMGTKDITDVVRFEIRQDTSARAINARSRQRVSK